MRDAGSIIERVRSLKHCLFNDHVMHEAGRQCDTFFVIGRPMFGMIHKHFHAVATVFLHRIQVFDGHVFVESQ